MVIKKIYDVLLERYGSQGWWPLLDFRGVNPTKTGSINGYHQGDYSFPKNEKQRFEIICGALLTQNTNWINVEKALINLKAKGLLCPKKISQVDIKVIKEAIKPAGYYNQKSERLKNLANFFLSLKNRTPLREELLKLKGIGFETADSILLYAYSVPVFVVDSYTKRVFLNLDLIKKDMGYEEIRSFIEENIEKDFKVYQEFHALLVEHAKRFYIKKKSLRDFLLDVMG